MSDSFQYGDIIFLGLIAVFIALRLRAMLGKNTGSDPREIWKQATRGNMADKVVVFPPREVKKPVIEEDVIPATLQENKPVFEGLKAIKKSDPVFNTNDFLSGAKLAFEWVVTAFAKGDKDKLKSLLSDERFEHFRSDIDARLTDGTSHETTLVSVLAADITEAYLQKSCAHITVQFTTEQISVMRDKDKNVVGGDLSAIEKVIDLWTFERDTSSRDPNWKITAT